MDQKPVDMTVLGFESPEMEELFEFRGTLFNEWLAAWKSLSVHDKDPYTHPVWVVSCLIGWSRTDKMRAVLDTFRLCFFRANGAIVGSILLRIQTRSFAFYTFYLLECPYMLGSSTLALDSAFHVPACEKLFALNIEGGHTPSALVFTQVDRSNSFLTVPVRKHIKTGMKRCFLDVTPDFHEQCLRAHENLPKNLRKWTRNLEKIDDLRFVVVDSAPEMYDAFEEMMDLEMKGWKGKTAYALRKNTFSRNTHYAMLKGFSAYEKAAIFLLKLGDQAISGIIAIVFDNILFPLKVVYDEKYAKMSPGTLIFSSIFAEYLPDHAFRQINCISKAEWFHSTWHGDYIDTCKMYLFPAGIKGIALKWLYSLYSMVSDRIKVTRN